MKVHTDLEYCTPTGRITTIPKGTLVIPAKNLPDVPGGRYWAEPWADMTPKAKSWHRNYGFLIEAHEVE